MGCSQRTGHDMRARYTHLSQSCQTVSLPYALMSTGKINHPQLGGVGEQKKKKNKVPRDLLLINNIHFLPRPQYTQYNTMIQLLGHSTQWVMKNIHHYISEYTNVETSINCSHMSYLPTSIIIFWPTKNMKKRYNNVWFIVLQSIILSHQSLRILGPDPHLPQNDQW